jgi:hypothetical protein
MTAFGKVLVFCNLALSLFLMTWALGIWTNRIDFSNTKATAEQSAGRFAVREAELANLWEGVRPAQKNWREARGIIAAEEARQVADWEFYHVELDRNRGKGNKPAMKGDPCRAVVYADKDNDKLGVRRGQVDLNPQTGLPQMVAVKDGDGNDLVALAAIDKALTELLDQRAVAEDQFKQQEEEAAKLTEQLIGPKGLQQRLIDEKQKRLDLLAEGKLVQPLLVNTYVESELIVKRHKQLQLRIAELQKIGVAARDR